MEHKHSQRIRPNTKSSTISRNTENEIPLSLHKQAPLDNQNNQDLVTQYKPHDNEDKDSSENSANMSDQDSLDKMSALVKKTISESMVEFRELLAKEIAGITKTSEDSISKLKKDMTTKLKTFQTKIEQNQKKSFGKIPQLEESIAKINEVMNEETREKINQLDGIIPCVEQIETKINTRQEGYDDLEKSLCFHIEDLESNKTKIEEFEAKIQL